MFDNGVALRFTGLSPEKSQELQTIIQMRFVNECPAITLPIFAIDKKHLIRVTQANRSFVY